MRYLLMILLSMLLIGCVKEIPKVEKKEAVLSVPKIEEYEKKKSELMKRLSSRLNIKTKEDKQENDLASSAYNFFNLKEK